MAIEQLEPNLAANIEQLLAGLRWRIRVYLWLNGLALVLAAIAAVFWTAVVLDWSFEPPRDIRLGMLVIAGLVIAYCVYRYLVGRVFVPLPDRSMAVILERKFDHFQETLLTAVELSSQRDQLVPNAREMLTHTCYEAAKRADDLRLGQIFNLGPLVASLLLAVGLALSVAGFAFAQPQSFRFALARLSTASDAPWPRYTRLIVNGFPNGEAVVAKGGDLNLIVDADTSMVVPENGVEIRYRTEQGVRERKAMAREGNAVAGKDPFQRYQYTFQGVLAPVEFEVRGGDARIRNLRIRVVDSPTMAARIHCEYPAYTHLSPREIPVTASVPLPRGSRVTIAATANKPLVRARVAYSTPAGKPVSEEIPLAGGEGSREFAFTLPSLDADTTYSFTLLDTDGIQNRDPLRVALSAVADTAPQVNVRLSGIGSAITPVAHIPLAGEITDEYGIARVWVEYAVNDSAAHERPLAVRAGDRPALKIAEAVEARDLHVKPGEKLSIGAKAADHFHLPGHERPNVGQGERFVLDVVTPQELLAMLEARELNLRQRFETIINEVVETRDSLARLEVGAPPPAAAAEGAKKKPVDGKDKAAEPGDEPVDADLQSPARRLERSHLRVERAGQNSQKNAQETDGVAISFDEIQQELVNNRVDTEELRIRLKDQIARPLHAISDQMFPELQRRLAVLQKGLGGGDVARDAAQLAAVAQADTIVVEMQKVRDRMLELETFNEALDQLRAIIAAQQRVTEQTKKERAEKARKLLGE